MDLISRVISNSNYTSFEREFNYNDKSEINNSILSLNFDDGNNNKEDFVTLEEFCMKLPTLIQLSKEKGQKNDEEKFEKNRIESLLSSLVFEEDEWKRFAFYDSNKNYTRNLVATDNKTYTLMLLCWSSGRESPIHDHPCDGCWFRVCKGEVQEIRYKTDPTTNSLNCTYNQIYKKGQQSYMEDSMGIHKVCNPSRYEPAVTLHLYCPPFQECKIWFDPCKASSCSTSSSCLYSEYGTRVKY